MPTKRLSMADRWLTGGLAVLFVGVGAYLVAVWLSGAFGFQETGVAIQRMGRPLGGVTIVVVGVLVFIRLIQRLSKR